jgi:ligand-binding sensor domain-containing protein/signal transduction histidine kinase
VLTIFFVPVRFVYLQVKLFVAVHMKRLLLIFVMLSTAASASAATPERGLQGYVRRVYGIASGLPEQTVQAFAQTPDHYLWIGTTGGLARFDGSHFIVFDRENTPAFHENSVFCLLAARDGSLWIGTEGSGLLHYQNGVFTAYGHVQGLTDMFVRALAQDSSGNIWVGTNNGVFSLAPATTHLERLDDNGSIPPLAVNAICQDSRGRLWLGGSGLAMLQNGAVRVYQFPGDSARNRVKAIAETGSGVVWVGTVSGLFRLLPGENHFSAVPGIHGTTRGLRRTSDGRFWLCILGQGAVAYHIDEQNGLTSPAAIPSDTVLAVFEDSEQNVWLGTETGMLRLSRTPLTIVPLKHASESDFGTVYQDREGTLWAAGTHLYRLHSAPPERYRAPVPPNVRVRQVLEDRDYSMWFGTDGSGVFHAAGGAVRQYTTRDGLVNNFIRVLLQAPDATVWIGTDEGVSHFNGRIFTNYQMKDGLAYQSIRAMLLDHAGDLWIGTELGLSHLRHGTFVDDAAVQSLRQDKVWALHEDREGSLWIGTRNNGLFRYRDNSLIHYRVEDGLASRSIYDIQEDASGRFWMSGPNGISVLNRQELDAFADGRTQHLALSFYSTSSDAEAVQVFGGMQSAGVLAGDGDVWYPSNRGLIHIAHGAMISEPSAPLVINSVRADGRDIPAVNTITLAPGDSRLEIDYASVMMRPQEAMRFKYQLLGLDDRWNEAGTRHVAEYTNIPPGRYTFRVAAYDLSRPDAIAMASLAIIKRPYFYRTWWFILLCALSIGAAIFAIHRARLARMERHFQAVLEERTRLAREVHDTILQGCTGISAVLEAVSSLDSEEVVLKHSLVESAREQLRTTINDAREAIWGLRHERQTPADLTSLIDTMRRQLSQDFAISIDCTIEGEPFPVNRPVAHELIMIAREAVQNAANHGGPSLVRMQLQFDEDTVALAVADDGCGFEPQSLPADEMHFGIIGMRERASKLGGTLELTSTLSVGTSVTVRVPRKLRSRHVKPTRTLNP